MQHDVAHEERQNAALLLIAAAVSQVAAHNGHSGTKTLVDEVKACLAAPSAVEEAHAAFDALDAAPEAVTSDVPPSVVESAPEDWSMPTIKEDDSALDALKLANG